MRRTTGKSVAKNDESGKYLPCLILFTFVFVFPAIFVNICQVDCSKCLHGGQVLKQPRCLSRLGYQEFFKEDKLFNSFIFVKLIWKAIDGNILKNLSPQGSQDLGTD